MQLQSRNKQPRITRNHHVLRCQSSKSVESSLSGFDPAMQHVSQNEETVAHTQHPPAANLLLDGGASVGTLPPDAGVMLVRGCCEELIAEELRCVRRRSNEHTLGRT